MEEGAVCGSGSQEPDSGWWSVWTGFPEAVTFKMGSEGEAVNEG